MSITLDDIKVALAIIENSEGQEISLRSGDIELNIRRGPPGAAAPAAPARVTLPTAAAPVAAPAAAAKPAEPVSSGEPPSPTAIPLHAPLAGVIYRAPAPDEPPFIEPGTTVSEDSVVCIIDVMKVMNLIKAPSAGRIARIDVQDGHTVAKGDVVMWVEPA